MEAQVTHHRRCYDIVIETARFFHHLSAYTYQFVPIYYPSLFIHRDESVRVSVVRQAQCALLHHFPLQLFRMSRTESIIDISAVRFIANDRYLCSQFRIYLFRHLIGCPIGTVQHQFDPLYICVYGGLEKIRIFRHRLIISLKTPSQHIAGNMAVYIDVSKNYVLYLIFNAIIQLKAVSVEEFYPIVFKRIV